MSVANPPTPDTPAPAAPDPAPAPPPPPPPTGPSGEPSGGRFTQEQLNTFLAEERRKWAQSDEHKQGLAALRRLAEIEEANKTEAERLTERAAAAERLAEERAANVPADRIDDAFRLADLSAVEVDEATDEVKGVDKAVKALVEGKAWLVQAPRPVPDINSGGGAANPQDPKAREEELRRRFRIS